MDVNTIEKKKKVGDYYTVASILGITTEAARMAWCRKKGKTFDKVKEAFIKVIDNREKLLNTK
jgi:hypothetical protein